MSVDKMDQLLPDRRNFIAYFAGLGLSSTLFPGVLWAQVQQRSAQKITKEMLIAAERIAGLNFTDAQREMMLLGVNGNLAFYEELRRVNLDVSDVPALRFSPILPGMKFDKRRLPFRPSIVPSLLALSSTRARQETACSRICDTVFGCCCTPAAGPRWSCFRLP